MNIIIDGIDGTGKTYLADKLKNKYKDKFMYRHLTAEDANDLKFHKELLESEFNNVYDRFMLGEMVYPVLYNREPKLSASEVAFLMSKIILNRDIYIVMTCSDKKLIKDRIEARGETFDYEEYIGQQTLFTSWANVLNSFGYQRFITVDVSDEHAYENLDLILDTYIRRECK